MKKIIFMLCWIPLSIWGQNSDTTILISGSGQNISITQDFEGSNFSTTISYNNAEILNGQIIIHPAEGERFDFFINVQKRKLVNSLYDAPYTPIALKWFSDGEHRNIWIQNFNLSNKKFEKLAAYIRGDETKILASCNTTSTDEKGRIKLESMEIHFANEKGGFPVNHSATYDDLQIIKKKILDFCFTCK